MILRSVITIFVVFIATISFCFADTYKLGINDVIKIQVYENPDLTVSVPVSPLGTIRFWLLGEVQVQGLTVPEAESRLAAALKKGGYIKSPQVMISVENYRSRQVSILGRVAKPGKLPIDQEVITLLDVVAMAGGLQDDAADHITLIRKNGTTSTKQSIDMYALFNGSIENNVPINPGDLIVVPRMDRFYIYGEISRPGAYRLEPNMTIMQALSIGGGLTAKGTDRGIRITRRLKNGKVEEIDVSLLDSIRANDVVYVKESLF
jgi:polysaccharide export outer membrane protein